MGLGEILSFGEFHFGFCDFFGIAASGFFFFFLHFVQVMGLGGVYCYWVFEIVVSFGNYIWVLLLHFFFLIKCMVIFYVIVIW